MNRISRKTFLLILLLLVLLYLKIATEHQDLNNSGPNDSLLPTYNSKIKTVYPFDKVTKKDKNATTELKIEKGEKRKVSLKGLFEDGNNLSDDIMFTFDSSEPEVAKVNRNGIITTRSEGVTVLTVTATLEGKTKSTDIFVIVDDSEERIADTTLLHEKIEQKIGVPAIIQPGDEFPKIKFDTPFEGKAHIKVIDPMGETLFKQLKKVSQGKEYIIAIPTAAMQGKYEVQLSFEQKNGDRVYDTLYFHVYDMENFPDNQSKLVFLNSSGKLVYTTDYRGNRIMDFSNSGYKGGGVKIPDVQARIIVKPKKGDDTQRIQKAIDFVSSLPLQKDGFRGAVLLKKGTYEVKGTLNIDKSGIVLRGEGDGENETILFATGKKKRNIIEVGSKEDSPTIHTDTKRTIMDLYVPVGNRSFRVNNSSGFKVGDSIIIRRYGNSSWIHEIDMDQIPDRGDTEQWEPFKLDFDRVITKIEGNIVTIDAPIPNAIERKWGGGVIFQYDDSHRLENVGVENIRVEVEFDPTVKDVHQGKKYHADEEKADTFLTFEYTKNAWMRNVTGLYLTKHLVNLGRYTKWITIQDSKSLEMVSLITGSRRYPFNYVGQLSLTQRVYSEKARHAFIFGKQMAGPNVILDSEDTNSFGRSEPHQRWATGGLFDNVTGNANAMDRAYYGTGHGWGGANFVFWNHTGELAVQQPPTAQNYAIGLIGERQKGDFETTLYNLREDGYWENVGRHVKPRSIYLQQLKERKGSKAIRNIKENPVGGGKLDNPIIPKSKRDN